MRICIYGEYTKNSLGDHLILYGLVRSVFRLRPDAHVTVVAQGRDNLEQLVAFLRQHAVSADGRLDYCPISRGHIRSRITKAIVRIRSSRLCYRTTRLYRRVNLRTLERLQRRETFDLLLLGGGQMFMDLFAVGVMEPLAVVRMFNARGIPARAFGIGAGPLVSRIAKDDAAEMLGMLEITGVRDRESALLLESVCPARRTVNVGDAALMLDLAEAQETPERIVGISAAAYHMKPYWPGADPAVFDRYISCWRRLTAAILDGDERTRLACVVSNVAQDGAAFREAVRDLPCSQWLAGGNSASLQDLLGRIRGIGVMVGSRMHSCIAAIVGGKPAVGIAYHPKVQAFFDECGLRDYCTEVRSDGSFDDGKILSALARLRAGGSSIKEYFAKIAARRTASVDMFRRFLELK